MNESSQKHSKVLKITSIVILALVGAILIGLTTVLVLRTIMPKKAAPASSSTATIATPTEIIAAYKAPETIDALSDKQYSLQEGMSSMSANVYFRSDEQSYAVSTPTKDSLTYTAKDVKQPDDSQAVQAQTSDFMSHKGLNKVTTPAQKSYSTLTYTTYANDQTICQLTDERPSANSGLRPFHQLACVAKTAIGKEYVAIQKLLLLNDTTKQLKDFQQITRTVTTEGNKSFATLMAIDTSGKSSEFLFAAVDNDWEYIGDLSAHGDMSKNTKYTISPAIEKAISAPKYGDFLTKYIH